MGRKSGVSRRDFIRTGCCTAASFALGATLGRLNMIHAMAAAPTSYQALVCVFLFGGNDSNNMFIPFDNAGYQNYATIRQNLALAQNTLLPVTTKTGQAPYALPPATAGHAGAV